MRFPTTIFLCCTLFTFFEASEVHQSGIDVSSTVGKETWLASVVSSFRRAADFKTKAHLATDRSSADIETLNHDASSQHEKANEKVNLPKAISSTLKAMLSRKSERQNSASSYESQKQVKDTESRQKLASMILAKHVLQGSVPGSAELGVNSTTGLNVMRMSAGQSASPTPIPDILFEDVLICKARNPIWNVGIRNKMGDLLIMAYPGSQEKAETFARCIRDDVTRMKREEYLKFAMYNCVGTPKCGENTRTGVCSCTSGSPERCINVDYTRALIECKYGPGVGA